MTSFADDASLTAFERRTTNLLQLLNEGPHARRWQRVFMRQFGRRWVHLATRNLLHIEGLERLRALHPDRGVLVCSNHRSYFDLYIICQVLMQENLPWAQHFFFPVRSDFFYETWTGLFINLLIGAGTMYPPVFRDPHKQHVNKLSVQRIVKLAAAPGNIIGMHPEGTRGQGPDPYTLLKAQPGVGQIALQAQPVILPVWIYGLTNQFVEQIASNFRKGDRRGETINVIFGEPLDLGRLGQQSPRPAAYKRVADVILAEIGKLGEQERVLRQRQDEARGR